MIKKDLARVGLLLALILGVMAMGNPVSAASRASAGMQQSSMDLKEATITLDNVTMTIRTPFLPSSTFGISSPGSVSQVADSSSPAPFSELAIVAVPFGYTSAIESAPGNPMPPARAGGADDYRAKLREYKIELGGKPQPGPTANLFGQTVASEATLLQLKLNTEELHPTLYVEWVVEAGPRVWIVRIVEQLPQATNDLSSAQPFLKSLSDLTISSSTLSNPTTLTFERGPGGPGAGNYPGMPPTGEARLADNAVQTLALMLAGLLLAGGGLLLSRRSRSRRAP